MRNGDGCIDALKQDEESLRTFLRGAKSFEDAMRQMLESGTDFTLKLEVRGNLGKVTYSRISSDAWERSSEKNGNSS